MASLSPSFSVIITAYNIEEYIETAIRSAIRQTYPPSEVIVVDDGSTDSTYSVAENILKNESEWKVIKQENKGPGGARNTGIIQASGDYIVFLDGDDWLVDSALEIFSKEAQYRPDAIFTNRKWFMEETKEYKSDNIFSKNSRGKIAPGRELIRRFAVPGKSFRRDFLLERDILFPEKMAWEDYPFSYQVLANSEAITVATDITYVARKRHGSNSSLTQKQRLADFFISSRFRQIDMDLDIIYNSKICNVFKNFNFYKVEFDNRLIKDIAYLEKESDDRIVLNALRQYQEYIKKNKDVIFGNVSPSVREIYQAILDNDLTACRAAIRQHKTM